MHQDIKNMLNKSKNTVFFGLIFLFLILVAIINKSDKKIDGNLEIKEYTNY